MAETPLIATNRKLVLLAGSVSVLTLAPIILLASLKGRNTSFGFIAADAFYYLHIANQWAEHGLFTYDGTRPVNGFHPLWQWYLALVFTVVPSTDAQILFSFVSSTILVSLALGVLSAAVARFTSSVPLGVLAALPGPICIVSAYWPHPIVPWSFCNGMESGLSMLLFAAFHYTMTDERGAYSLRAGILLALLVLARLDDVFLLLALLLVWPRLAVSKGTWRPAALFFGPSLLAGICYLIWSRATAGSWLPLSGVAKFASAWRANFDATLVLLAPDRFSPFEAEYLPFRVLQVLLPAVVAVFVIARKARAAGTTETYLLALSGYMCLKGFYNFLFVDFWSQGSWYFAVSFLALNALLVSEAAGLLKANVAARSVLLAVAAGATVGLFNKMAADLTFSRRFQSCKHVRAQASALVRPRGVIELDDGWIAYCLPVPALHGLGFLLDRESFESLRRGKLLEHAYRNGFSYLALGTYAIGVSTSSASASIRRALARAPHFHWESQNLDAWNFELAFDRYPLQLIRFSPRYELSPLRGGDSQQ